MNDSPLTLYQQGALAFKQARYPDAIASLEQFCKATAHRQSKQFLQAQMWLIQAYHKDRKDLHAISLCEQLAKSDVPQVRQWATQALDKLMTVSSPSETPPSSRTPQLPSAHPQNSFDAVIDQAPPTAADPPLPLPVEEENPFDLPSDAEPLSSSESWSANLQEAGRVTSKAAMRPTRQGSTVQPNRASMRSRDAKKSRQKDLTPQIMSAIAHGSISMLASILLFILFSDSILANGLGILRFAAPLLIFFTTPDKIVKENAREALNYTITCLILFIPLIFAMIALALIFALVPPIGFLLGLILGAYLLTFSFYPIVATFLCMTQQDRVVEYPNWLILHLV
ncbi:MAG: DUF4870 domain-containing protein [Leptolyngbya sp. SIOISBB]|nr:DUF4870 domain-containing protein [Leptolyngbya sp. SIOISBB]